MGHSNHFLTAALGGVITALVTVALSSPSRAGQAKGDVPDMTGQYHFLSPDDTLAILDEDGKLKGYIDVYQSDQESDDILSYPITIGSREKNHVEFKTGTIHDRYYRFSGAVERGRGRRPDDADFLRLVGDVEVIVKDSVTGKESVGHEPAVFKSKSKSDRQEDP